MVYAVKTDGYSGFEGEHDYCTIELFDTEEEYEEYYENDPKSSSECRELFELEDFEDALNCLINQDGVYPDNLHEIFSRLVIEFDEE